MTTITKADAKAFEEGSRQFAAALAVMRRAWVVSVLRGLSEDQVLALWREVNQSESGGDHEQGREHG